MQPRIFLIASVAGVLAGPLLSPVALATGVHGAHHASSGAPAISTDWTDGEVRKIDREGGKVTLRHAEIKSLDMPPMTMVFRVREKAVLDKLQIGSRVQFQAVSEAGEFVVTELKVRP